MPDDKNLPVFSRAAAPILPPTNIEVPKRSSFEYAKLSLAETGWGIVESWADFIAGITDGALGGRITEDEYKEEMGRLAEVIPYREGMSRAELNRRKYEAAAEVYTDLTGSYARDAALSAAEAIGGFLVSPDGLASLIAWEAGATLAAAKFVPAAASKAAKIVAPPLVESIALKTVSEIKERGSKDPEEEMSFWLNLAMGTAIGALFIGIPEWRKAAREKAGKLTERQADLADVDPVEATKVVFETPKMEPEVDDIAAEVVEESFKRGEYVSFDEAQEISNAVRTGKIADDAENVIRKPEKKTPPPKHPNESKAERFLAAYRSKYGDAEGGDLNAMLKRVIEADDLDLFSDFAKFSGVPNDVDKRVLMDMLKVSGADDVVAAMSKAIEDGSVYQTAIEAVESKLLPKISKLEQIDPGDTEAIERAIKELASEVDSLKARFGEDVIEEIKSGLNSLEDLNKLVITCRNKFSGS